MRRRMKMKNKESFVKGGCTAWVVCLLAMMMTGCKTHERIVEVVRTDTLIVKDVQRDSVYVESMKHDSVYIHQKGDTMWVEKWHTEWRDRWRDRETHDTIYQSKTDTVRVKEVVAGKASTMTRWQKLRMTLGDIALIVMLFILLLYVVRYVIMKVVRP
jgi:hypothetical protein